MSFGELPFQDTEPAGESVSPSTLESRVYTDVLGTRTQAQASGNLPRLLHRRYWASMWIDARCLRRVDGQGPEVLIAQASGAAPNI
jgi:hypothetical protein